MILDDNEISERVESPINLINRLRSTMTPKKDVGSIIPSLPPSSKDIIPNLDEKLAIGSIKHKASQILVKAMTEIEAKVSEGSKTSDLIKIAAEMNKIVIAETENNKGNENRPVFNVFTPQLNVEQVYETIYARGE